MRSRPRTLIVAAAAAAVLTGCSQPTLENLPAPAEVSGATYRVSAEFRDILNLTIGAKVKLEGVVIGDVTSITTKNYVALVKMEVEKQFPITADATFQVRFTTPLGEDFISVTSVNKPGATLMRSGTVVRLAHTSDAASIEDTFAAVSTLLNGGGLDQLHTIATELQTMLHGRTGAARDLLTQLHTVVTNLEAHKGDIDRALTSIQSVGSQLNSGNALINQALNEFPQTIQLLANDTARIESLLTKVAKLGDTVKSLVSQSADHMVATLDNLAPTLDALRAADADLIPTFNSLIRFGKLFDRAAPGDYVNINGTIVGLLGTTNHPYLPPKGGVKNSASAQQITDTPATSNSADTVRALLGGGTR